MSSIFHFCEAQVSAWWPQAASFHLGSYLHSVLVCMFMFPQNPHIKILVLSKKWDFGGGDVPWSIYSMDGAILFDRSGLRELLHVRTQEKDFTYASENGVSLYTKSVVFILDFLASWLGGIHFSLIYILCPLHHFDSNFSRLGHISSENLIEHSIFQPLSQRILLNFYSYPMK